LANAVDGAEKLAGWVEILSAYLGSFGAGGVGVNRAFRSEAIRSLIEMSLNTADANHDRPKPRKPKS
jgi:hypothetical protein